VTGRCPTLYLLYRSAIIAFNSVVYWLRGRVNLFRAWPNS